MVVALIIIVLSLLQGGKSQGASGAITGGGMNIFAKTKERGSELVVTWLTFSFAIIFFFIAILVSVFQPESSSTSTSAIRALIDIIH